ncbi:MAG: copper ion binding protein [Oscillospiraceae bacterium]|nr:copper ion binding protein [Oscillospiraceae bacterium]
MKKTLKIEGMSCEHCVAAVKKALDAVDGVSAAEVDLDSGTAVIDIAGAVTDETLRAAIEDEGYSVAEIA